MALLRYVLLLLLFGAGFRWMGKFHSALPVVLAVVVVCNIVAIWMLRFEKAHVTSLARYRWLATYFCFVNRISGQLATQTIATSKRKGREWLLNSSTAYLRARHDIKQRVRGHDFAIDGIFTFIEQEMLLRSQRRKRKSLPPVASFVLVGQEGIGKRFLATVLSAVLYKNGAVTRIDCSKANSGLFGIAGSTGELPKAVHEDPFRLLLFENLDAAAPEVCQEIIRVMKSGVSRSGKTECSYSNTVWILTTTKGAEQLVARTSDMSPSRIQQEKVIEGMVAATQLDSQIFNAASEVIALEPPNDLTKSEVVAILMQKEATEHGLSLSYVDPVIIASESIRITRKDGFENLPQSIKKLMSKPLLAASRSRQKQLSLQVCNDQLLSKGTKSEKR